MKKHEFGLIVILVLLFIGIGFLVSRQVPRPVLPENATVVVENDLTVMYEKDGNEYVACKSNILVGYKTTDQLKENYICDKESVFITRSGWTIMGNVSVSDYTPTVGQKVVVKTYFSLVDPIHRSTTTYRISDCEIEVGNGLWQQMTTDTFTFSATKKEDVNIRCLVTEDTDIQANFTLRTGE